MNTSGIQRVVDLLWSKPLENEDHINELVVLGRRYSPQVPADKQLSDGVDEVDGEAATEVVPQVKQLFFAFTKRGAAKDVPWPEEFVRDVNSRLWFTYRTRFPPLERDADGPSPLSLGNLIRGSNYDLQSDHFTSDCGWGCMIRTGQTMLGNALLHLHVDRDWRYDPSITCAKHDEIVSWFADTPSRPFSIHNIVEQGRVLSQKKAGEWFGPSATARSIQALCSTFDSGLQVYIGADSGDIYEQDLFKVVKDGQTGEFRPTLVLLGVRLGVDKVNSIYWQSLKELLALKQSVGIAGGRPSSSHYFFGYQGDYLFYLDPHIPQLSLKDDDLAENSASESTQVVSALDITTVHTDKIRKIHLSDIDPSMLIGTLICDEDDWNDWKRSIQNPESKNKIIHISPDENPERITSFRKPSFVVHDDDDYGFVDVGLEYEDIKEDDEQRGVEAGEDTDPVVIASDAISEPTSTRERLYSYVEYSEPEIKDDYEDVEDTQNQGDLVLDDSAIEVESLAEDPVVVVADLNNSSDTMEK